MARVEAAGRREVSPFQTLGSTVDYAIEKAESTEEGSTLEVLTAMLMSAMMVEAVLNHVGAQLFAPGGKQTALWRSVERARPEDKLEIICERIRYQLDFSREPFQQFRPMFKFRNLIAHGKTEVIQNSVTVEEDELHTLGRLPEFMPEWERKCTIENARRFSDAAGSIAVVLCRESGVQYPIDHGFWGRQMSAPAADED